jgi:hypothetical protein
VVLKGLKPGDRIVSSANFLVDSEAQLQTAIGSFAATPAAAEKTPAGQTQQMEIEMTTQPSPLRRGANTVLVQVKASDGKPVTAAEVKVTFYMPAMPAMGMAAKRVDTNLVEKEKGAYEGALQMDSGGTWNVTIVVSRGGQVLATRTLSVNATGGMG